MHVLSAFHSTCSDDVMTIFATFDNLKFKGRIYASDYSDENECGVTRTTTDPSENVVFRLPLGQCGIQMTVLDNVGLRYYLFFHIRFVKPSIIVECIIRK